MQDIVQSIKHRDLAQPPLHQYIDIISGILLENHICQESFKKKNKIYQILI